MIRNTSIEIYNKIKDNGLLSKRRLEVYEAVFNNGPATAVEIFNVLGLETNQSGRFTELRDMGCLSEVGTKECSITGNESILWDVTCDLPRYLPKVLSKKEKKRKLQYNIIKLGKMGDLSEKSKEQLRGIYAQVKAL